MKVHIKFLLLIFSLSRAAKEKFTTGTRFRAIECVGDNVSVSFEYCNVKAYSAKVAVLNIGLKVLTLIEKPFYVQIVYSYRFGNIYRPMIDSKRIEFCAILEGLTGNPIMKLFTDDLLQAYPNLFHPCPFDKGNILNNLVLKNLKYFVLRHKDF
jgi:hypothetical protein